MRRPLSGGGILGEGSVHRLLLLSARKERIKSFFFLFFCGEKHKVVVAEIPANPRSPLPPPLAKRDLAAEKGGEREGNFSELSTATITLP